MAFRTNAARALLVVLAVLCANRAVSACPEGMVTQQGQGVIACMPGPSYAPPPQFPNPEPLPPEPPPPDPLANEASFMMNFVKLQQLEMTRLQEMLKKDPKLNASYERQKAGEWRHVKPVAKAAPGEGCIAIYGKAGKAVALLGPSPAFKGALLVFIGPKLPSPAAPRQIAMTLEQTGEKPASVRVHNYRIAGTSIGAVAFAVPSLDAALAGMLDRHRFGLIHDGQKVLDIEWSGGKAAQAKLRACAATR